MTLIIFYWLILDLCYQIIFYDFLHWFIPLKYVNENKMKKLKVIDAGNYQRCCQKFNRILRILLYLLEKYK